MKSAAGIRESEVWQDDTNRRQLKWQVGVSLVTEMTKIPLRK